MKRILRYSVFVAITALITTGTTLIPQRVNDQAGLADVRYGYPVSFLTEDCSGLDPPSFPQFYHCCNPWEYPTTISWSAYALSWLMVSMVVLGVYTALKRLNQKMKQKRLC